MYSQEPNNIKTCTAECTLCPNTADRKNSKYYAPRFPPHATNRGSNLAPITAIIDRETRYHRPREGPTGPTCAAWRPWHSGSKQNYQQSFQGLHRSDCSPRGIEVAHRTRNRRATTKEAELLKPKLPRARQRAMEQASEKGASSWLTAIQCPNMASTCTNR